MKKEKVIITGAGGTLGQEFIKQLVKDCEVEAVDNNEWALAELKEFKIPLFLMDFSEYPDYKLRGKTIIHCAAYKHVDLCEQNPDSCMDNNYYKSHQFYNDALDNKAKDFIFISTDKAVEPESTYGVSKASMEEIIVEDKLGKIIRLGNIYGSSGSVIPLWEKAIAEEKPLPITDLKMKRYFIPAADAVSKILDLIPKMEQGQIGIPAMGREVTLAELKDKILQIHGLDSVDYPIKVIGKRPGEKMQEKLVNDDEEEVLLCSSGKIYAKKV